jgi:hypothetical protein
VTGPFPAFLLLLLSAGQMLAQANPSPDSARVLPHRSRAETIAALPGLALYLPFHLGFAVGGYAISAIWEERLLDRAKAWLTTADGRTGIRPLANTNLGTGVYLFREGLLWGGGAGLTATRGQPVDKRQHYHFSLSWSQVKLGLEFSQEPKENFYGIGPDAAMADRVRFLHEELRAQLEYRRRLRRRLGLETALGYSRIDIHPGLTSPGLPSIYERYAAGKLPGLDDRLHFLDLSAGLRASYVDVPGSPTRGNLTLLRLAYTQSVDDDNFSHLSALAVSEQFFDLFYRRIVSLRLGGEWRATRGDAQIPFYQLASLGGNEFLRGYSRGRFRDRGAALAGATYKFPVWKLLDGLLFYESGRTFSRPGDLKLGRWKDSWGGGVRVWVPEGVLFEQSIARSSEGTRLLFNLKALF